jgi:diguanylate cyclase (GGDEF)-like protein
MNLSYSNRSLSLLPSILVLWIIIGIAAINWINPLDLVLALSLLAITLVFTLFNLLKFSGWIVTILSLGFFGFYKYSMVGSLEEALVPILMFSTVQIVATLLGSAIMQQSKTFYRQLEMDQKTLEDLRIRDPETNLTRYPYAIQRLKTEIARSRRKENNICLLLIQSRNTGNLEDPLDHDELDEYKKIISTMMISNTRLEDIVFINDYYGAILPETNSEGAAIVARRIINQASKNNRLDLYAGIAVFPSDAVTEQNLIKAAEYALENAKETDSSITFFTEISDSI